MLFRYLKNTSTHLLNPTLLNKRQWGVLTASPPPPLLCCTVKGYIGRKVKLEWFKSHSVLKSFFLFVCMLGMAVEVQHSLLETALIWVFRIGLRLPGLATDAFIFEVSNNLLRVYNLIRARNMAQ